MNEPRCDECKFSRPHDGSGAQIPHLLVCHRYPMTQVMGTQGAGAMYNCIQHDYWCGEFVSKFPPP